MARVASRFLGTLSLLAVLAHGAAVAATVTGVRLGEHPDKTRLVLDMDGKGAFAIESSADGRDLEIVLDGAVWKAPSSGKGKGLVDGFIYLGGADDESRLMLALKASGRVKRAFSLTKPDRIVIDMEPAPVSVAAKAAPSPSTTTASSMPKPNPPQRVAAATAPTPPAEKRVDPHLLALDALLTPLPSDAPVWSDPDRSAPAAGNACELVKPRAAQAGNDPEALFLWAECARSKGNLPLAAQYYREVLAINPGAQRARLELADVLFQLREHEQSREQFAKVLDSKPPKTVAANVKARMSQVEMHQKGIDPPKDWTARVSGGVVYDTNVNGGPGGSQVTLFGTDFTLDDTSLGQKDWGVRYGLEGRLVLDESTEHKIDLAGGWSSTKYKQYGDYEVDSLYLRGSLQQKYGDTVATFPVLATRAWVGGKGYSKSYTFSPEARHPLNDTTSLFASVPVGITSYDTSTTKDGKSVGAKAGGQFIIDKTWVFRPALSLSQYTASSSTESYTALGIGMQLMGKLDGRWLLSGSAGFTKSDYKTIDETYGIARRDGTATLGAGLAWDLRDYYEGLALSLNYGYTRADSTITTYDYDRHQTMMTLSKTF